MEQMPDDPGLSNTGLAKEQLQFFTLTATVTGRRKRRPGVEMGRKAVCVIEQLL